MILMTKFQEEMRSMIVSPRYGTQHKLCIHVHVIHNRIALGTELKNMGLAATKPVFGVSDKVSFKSVSSAIETS